MRKIGARQVTLVLVGGPFMLLGFIWGFIEIGFLVGRMTSIDWQNKTAGVEK